MMKELNEMTVAELQAVQLAAVDAGHTDRAECIGHYIAAGQARRICEIRRADRDDRDA